MIEINLLPGAKRRRKRRQGLSLSLSLPSREDLPDFDGWIAFVIAAWLIAPAVGGWMFLDVRERTADLEASVEEAVADSARYARVIETTERLQARRDTIAQKLELIQELDAGRYVWPHLMDEIGRALPDYTWLSRVYQVQGGARPQFRVEGYAGNLFAFTRFMQSLELSPFVRAVEPVSTELVTEGGELLYAFMIEAEYEDPPPDAVETVPLFTAEE